jgi:hypothetical protein
MYNQIAQKGNQVLYYTGGAAIPGIERMYSVDVVRFEVYYLTEEAASGAKKLYATTTSSLYREKNLRLVKAESKPYLVYDKFKSLKRNLDLAWHAGDLVLPSNPNPNDFPTVYNAIRSTTTGVYFDSISKLSIRSNLTQMIEYADNATGPVIRDMSLVGADGFSAAVAAGTKISFAAKYAKVFLSNEGLSRGINLSVGYNTKWTTGETLGMDSAKHIPWFAQQPELLSSVSPVSDFFPSGFEVSGSGFGVSQRVGIRLCLWMRRSDHAATYSHYVVAARAQ